jgi:hypothetical protein
MPSLLFNNKEQESTTSATIDKEALVPPKEKVGEGKMGIITPIRIRAKLCFKHSSVFHVNSRESSRLASPVF